MVYFQHLVDEPRPWLRPIGKVYDANRVSGEFYYRVRIILNPRRCIKERVNHLVDEPLAWLRQIGKVYDTECLASFIIG